MKNTIIGMLTVIIDKQIIGDFRIVNVRKDHDSMTWAKLLRDGHTAYGLNESLAYYRKVEGSISNNKFEAAKNHWRIGSWYFLEDFGRWRRNNSIRT